MNRPDWDQILDSFAEPYDGPCFCPEHDPTERDWDKPHTPIATSTWSLDRALAALDITWSPESLIEQRDSLRWTIGSALGHFDGLHGESWVDPDTGKRHVWVAADARYKVRTVAHELAHALHGHTAIPKDVRTGMIDRQIEAEAEMTAALVVSRIIDDDTEYARMAQHSHYYLSSHYPAALPQAARARVKRVAEQIIAAGLDSHATIGYDQTICRDGDLPGLSWDGDRATGDDGGSVPATVSGARTAVADQAA